MFLLNHFSFQNLGGKIENISCQDLVHLNCDLYFLILQKLKEKAIEIENLIEKTKGISDHEIERTRLSELEKEVIKVIPTMNLVRTLVKLSSLYQGHPQGDERSRNISSPVLSKKKQSEIQV